MYRDLFSECTEHPAGIDIALIGIEVISAGIQNILTDKNLCISM